MRRFLAIIIPALVLTACSGPEDPVENGEPESPASAAPADRQPDTGSEESIESARRERLREAMRQHREEAVEAIGDSAESQRRERLQARREAATATPWWEDDEVVSALELEDGQIETLRQAARDRQQSRVTARQEMVEARRELSRDIAEGDRERSQTQIEKRNQARQRVQSADEQWLNTITDTLNEAQLEHLEALRPRALADER